MAPNLLDELEKIVALSEKATPGMVELHTSCSWRRIVAERGRPFLVPIIDPDRHQNMDTVESAEFVVALVNWFRTHAPALADMAKRMEAAERECEEQARLNGMGAERELALRARLEAAERDAERWRALRFADAPIVTVTGEQLRKGIRPGDYAVPWDWPITAKTKIRLIAIDATQEGAG